jgi:hypothetical protein
MTSFERLETVQTVQTVQVEPHGQARGTCQYARGAES